MADAKITGLTDLPTVDDTDVLVIVDDVSGTPITKKITRANLFSGYTQVGHTHSGSDITDFDELVGSNSAVAANTAKISFDTTSSSKLASIETGAEVNVQSDWNAISGDAYIANKPSIPSNLSDLSDDSTHRVVTDTEKSTWNAKQNALVADTDYLVPITAALTYEPKKGANDNYVTDAEKVNIGNLDSAAYEPTSSFAPALGTDDNYVTDVEKTNIGNLDSAAYEPVSAFAPALSSDDNYVTDAEKIVIGNTSGTNTGDQTIVLQGDVSGTGSGTFTTSIGSDIIKDYMLDFGTGTNQISTADIPEQTNLYYTEARVSANSNVAANSAKISYTDAVKVAGIEDGAEVNNISNANAWELTTGSDTTLHNHNGLYYTETEIDNLIGSYSLTSHTHTESDITDLGSYALSTEVKSNLTDFTEQTAWRVFYSNTDGDVTELPLGADGTFLKSNGVTSAPTFAAPTGGGDVSKVGTPVNNQIGVWTGDGTIEGTSGLTYDGSTLSITGNITLNGTVDGIDIATDVAANTSKVTNATHTGDVTGATTLTVDKTAITGKTEVTAVGSDYILISDTSDTGNLKKALISDVLGGSGISNLVDDTTPQLGGNLDRNNKSIIIIETAGENLSAGDLCYLKSDGKYWKADASTDTTSSSELLLCNATITADASGEFIEFGEYTTTGLTTGSKYFVSETTGEFTSTAPATSNAVVRIIGYALSTTVLKFRPDTTYIKLV